MTSTNPESTTNSNQETPATENQASLINIGTGYNPETQRYLLRMEIPAGPFLEAHLDKTQFQDLSSRLIRLLKDVALLEAQIYLKEQEEAKNKEVENAPANNDPSQN